MTASFDLDRLSTITAQLSELIATQSGQSITFGELFDLYFEKHAAKRNRAPKNARYFFQRHGAAFADRPVNSLTQRELQEWVDGISDLRGSAGAKRAIDMLSAVIAWGVRRGYVSLSVNPCKAVERHAPKPRTRFIKPHELQRLADVLRDEPPLWRDYVWLSLFTGARRGNTLAMRWDDIDFELAQWTIPETKNGEELVIALTSKALALLQQRRAKADPANPWVFPGEGKAGHIVDVKRMWKRVCQKAGITNLRIHDLRRSLASYMAIQGDSPYQIGKALGHRDPRSTAIYARLDLSDVRGQLESVHERWLINCLKEVQPDNPPLHKMRSLAAVPTTKPERIGPRQQVLVEGRIIIAMQHGATTKKELYSKIGGKLGITASDLDRILEEMEAREIVERYRDAASPRHWQHWRYRLAAA
jgi:integrase